MRKTFSSLCEISAGFILSTPEIASITDSGNYNTIVFFTVYQSRLAIATVGLGVTRFSFYHAMHFSA